MFSEKFPNVLKDDFKVLIKFFRKCQLFLLNLVLFSFTKRPKSRRIRGMCRADLPFQKIELPLQAQKPVKSLYFKPYKCRHESHIRAFKICKLGRYRDG